MSKPTSDCRATERKHPWPMVRLGELGTMVRGNGIKRCETIEAGYPCLRYGEIYTSFNVILDRPRSFVPKELFDKCVKIKKGDLVFTLTGENTEEIAKTLAYLGEGEIAAGGDLAVWTGHGCDSKYLAYLMYSPQLISQKAATGNGNIVVHTSIKKLQQLEIPLPPLPVQREIVARLERELAAVEKMEKGFEELAETAKQEFKAELKEVFEGLGGKMDGQARPSGKGHLGWRKLGEVCEKIGSGATPLGGKKTYQEKGTSLIRSQNVIDFSFSFSGLAHINETQAAQLDSVSVLDGDVLVNITGDSVARVCIVDNRCLPARVNQHVAIIRLSHSANVLNRYLEACLVAMKDELLKEAVKGSTRKALTKDYLVNLEIPLPSLAVQREVVARLDVAKDRAEKLEAKAREGVAVCEAMRKAILKEAFE